MKQRIPIHRHEDLFDNGIFLKVVTQEDIERQTVDYAHRDNYYIFGIILRGRICMNVDFKEQWLKKGQSRFILPGQVHRFISSENFEGCMLMVESGVVDDCYKLIFEEASVNGMYANVDEQEFEELKSIFALIHELSDRKVDIKVIHNLVSAFIGIVADSLRRIISSKIGYNRRYTQIVMQLNSLLQCHIAQSHSPSFYADKLHISTVYLNEVVNNVSGFSTSAYIRNEIVLQAKRMLYHTDMMVKEIALSLGFEDIAYFTRLFTRATGKSPTYFRIKP